METVVVQLVQLKVAILVSEVLSQLSILAQLYVATVKNFHLNCETMVILIILTGEVAPAK